MTNATFTITPVPSFRTEAIAEGYVFECSCGELYNNIAAASSCRKCRKCRSCCRSDVVGSIV